MSAVVDVAAIVGGFTIIGGAAWRWVVGPAFTRQVRDIVQAENAAALQPIMDASETGSRSGTARPVGESLGSTLPATPTPDALRKPGPAD